MNNNIKLYNELLSTRLNLDSNTEEDGSFCIPISLISEENMANRFIENTKALIRSSIEYKQWCKWFKNQYNPIVCSVSDNTSTIEIHHHPLTLEDYVDFAISFIYNNGMTYSAPIIADIVMRWHYMNIVGACYMSKTYHMRFHEDHDIVIPEESIQGNIKDLLTNQMIRPSITNYIIDKIVNYCPKFAQENAELLQVT